MTPLIIAWEGMGNAPYVENGLIRPLVAKYPELRAVVYPYTYSGGLPANHNYASHSYNHPEESYGGKIICVGHSLGGEAALRMAGEFSTDGLKRYTVTCVTLDPRRNNLFSWIDWIPFLKFQRPFLSPPGVRCLNFYRPGFMNGYRVTGAVNTRLSCGHVAVPRQKEVMDCLVGLIEEAP